MSSIDELEKSYNTFVRTLSNKILKEKEDILRMIEDMEDKSINIIKELKTSKD